MNEKRKEALQAIHKMRQPGKNGRPKHTQADVADELGMSQSYISRLEREMDIRPDKDASTPHLQPSVDTDTHMTDETPDETPDNSDEWTCTNCGSTRWYDADEYATQYGNALDKGQLTVLVAHDRVCYECGEVQ